MDTSTVDGLEARLVEQLGVSCSLKEAAAALGMVSIGPLRRAAAEGSLVTWRAVPGGTIRVTARRLAEWLAEREQHATTN